MAIASSIASLLPLQLVVAPLQAFAAWLAPRPVTRPTQLLSVPVPAARSIVRPACMRRPVRPQRSPVRVTRTADAPLARASGHMVISGRLADVCAELDRLAAQEAAGRR